LISDWFMRSYIQIFLISVTLLSPVLLRAENSGVQVESPIGLNKFDLFNQYVGQASGCGGGGACQRVTTAMAQKSLDDARDVGVKLMRVSVSGFAPSAHGERGDLDLWRSTPSVFWSRMDAMMDDLDSHGIRLVPVLMWNVRQFPSMANETVGDLIRNPNSQSWRLLATYAEEFVRRYRGRKTIVFYELSNELNLGADLDNIKRCASDRRGKLCDVVSNFTTDEMLVFIKRFAELVRKSDTLAMISSGFSVPRGAAEHLRAHPHGRPGGPDWSLDTREQFAKNLSAIHDGLDIISIHLYDEDGDQNKRRRFGSTDPLDVLAAAKEAADMVHKPLFVGEFGDARPRNAGNQSHTARMITKIKELHIPYSAVWVWEYYPRKPLLVSGNSQTAFSLEPGYTDLLIRKIREANSASAKQPSKLPAIDRKPPRVVLTWPLECNALKSPINLHAVASDDGGAIKWVDFLLDGGRIGSDDSPPYQATLPDIKVITGVHRLTARAYDFSGNTAEFSTEVIVGGKATDIAACLSSIE